MYFALNISNKSSLVFSVKFDLGFPVQTNPLLVQPESPPIQWHI